MKGFFKVLAAAMAVCLMAASCAACDGNNSSSSSESSSSQSSSSVEVALPSSVSVVMPDGAPALSMAGLMDGVIAQSGNSEGVSVSYEVVNASTINTFVTGANPSADFCVLPVNMASKLLGSGETYQLVAGVTHGNLFLLSSKHTETAITTDNLSDLIGKKVGVVNLANVPGLTFKVVLNRAGIAYASCEVGAEANPEAVNLLAIEAADVGTLAECDYYIAPEPAASLKVSKIPALEFVGDLQALYGSETNTYPQAVLVAKKSMIENYPEFTADFVASIEASCLWLNSNTYEVSTVIEAINAHLTDGMTPTFNAVNLTHDVIAKCNVRFVASSEYKDEIVTFLSELVNVNPNAAGTVTDAFFYGA